MAKTKISEFSATPANNTDIDSINIAEGCAPSGINDAIRELMAQLKDFQTGAVGDSFNGPVGTTTAAAGAFTTLAASGAVTLSGGTANGVPYLNGSKVLTSGSALVFDGSNLGLGVTPSATGASYKSFELGFAGIGLNARSNATLDVDQGVYWTAGSAPLYASTGVAAAHYRMSSGTHAWSVAPSGTAGNAITFTQAMTLNASGNLLLGTTTVGTSGTGLTMYGASQAEMRLQNSTTGTGTTNGIQLAAAGSDFYLWNFEAGSQIFGTSGVERARITSSGELLVGKTSASDSVVGFAVSASGYFTATSAGSTNATSTNHVYSTGAGAYRFYVGMGGTINATSTTITGISDQRLKENIRDLDDGLNVVMALKPRKFDWKAGKGQDIKNARGFIAQEFEQVLPDMIETWKDPAPEGEEPYKAVNANLIPTLVKAIQELHAIVATLQADVAALKAAA